MKEQTKKIIIHELKELGFKVIELAGQALVEGARKTKAQQPVNLHGEPRDLKVYKNEER